MTYEEFWVAQVRARARVFAHVYSKLQSLIKGRTREGYTHGFYEEDQIKDWNCVKEIIHESDTIKVVVKAKSYPPKGNKHLAIYFCIKR